MLLSLLLQIFYLASIFAVPVRDSGPDRRMLKLPQRVADDVANLFIPKKREHVKKEQHAHRRKKVSTKKKVSNSAKDIKESPSSFKNINKRTKKKQNKIAPKTLTKITLHTSTAKSPKKTSASVNPCTLPHNTTLPKVQIVFPMGSSITNTIGKNTFCPYTVIPSFTLNYYNGPILGNVEVNPIFYGNTTQYQAGLIKFYNFLVTSPIMDLLGQYSTKTTKLSYGTVKPAYVEKKPLKSINDTQIQQYLRGLVKSGTLKPNKNSYYPLHFPPHMDIVYGSLHSCVDFCGYHSTISISDISSTPYLSYGIIPDQSGDCFGGCGASFVIFEGLTSVATHEFAESVTNPGKGLATRYSSPLGWYNGYYGEIGDECNSQLTYLKDINGTSWAVCNLWSNKDIKISAPTDQLREHVK
ncbi:hypothetical protein BC830DRAFT_1084180 [Chytriomyces sp. MP71]|nr:hypothetical protein BC830DRAFT_1084180 [Chytriomyces sp. MP71]